MTIAHNKNVQVFILKLVISPVYCIFFKFFCKLIYILESFNLWRLLLMIVLYYQTRTPISFWCRQGLNLRSLIQPLETIPVKVTIVSNKNIIIGNENKIMVFASNRCILINRHY